MPRPTICSTFKEALAGLPDGASIMVPGFGGAGAPTHLINALYEHGAKELTVILNSIGITPPNEGPPWTIANIAAEGRVRRVYASFTTSPYPSRRGKIEELIRAGQIEAEVMPQGTLAERIRAAGAGIPAFFTPAGVGTQLAEGKEYWEFEGRGYVMERALDADYAFIHAHKADTAGNLVYRFASRNFGPIMAMAARHVIAEVEEIVPAGEIRPDEVHTPGVYVERMVQIPLSARQQRLPHPVPARDEAPQAPGSAGGRRRLNHDQIAATIARFIQPGWIINLGFGIPTRVCSFIDRDAGVMMTSENGVLGYGMIAPEGMEDPDIVNAAGDHVILNPGAAIVHHADSFALIRRGMLDCTVLGAYQVAADGSFANWKTPAGPTEGLGTVGGAMDLAAGSKTLFIAMEHTTRQGEPRLVERRTLPITAPGGVSLVVTDIAVVAVRDGGFELIEHHPDWTAEEIRAHSGAPLSISPDLRPIAI